MCPLSLGLIVRRARRVRWARSSDAFASAYMAPSDDMSTPVLSFETVWLAEGKPPCYVSTLVCNSLDTLTLGMGSHIAMITRTAQNISSQSAISMHKKQRDLLSIASP
jgi:hypothetical protein